MLAIPRDDQIGARCDGGGDDLVVIGIAEHHARHAGRLDQVDGLDVIGQHLAR